MISQQIKTISDMRERANELLKEVQVSDKPFFILSHSKPQAVLLNLEEYQKLTDFAEDYIDSLKAQEYEKQDKEKIRWVTHEEVKNLL